MTVRKAAMRWRRLLAIAALLAASWTLAWGPTAQAAGTRDDVAVIIGNKTYAGATPAVEFADNDARAMRRFVIERLGYRPGNVIDLRDATLARLREMFGNETTHKGKLYDWVRAGKSSVVVFYSGHGVPGLNDRRGYLLPVDGDPNRAEISGYSLDLLLRNLSRLEAKSVTVYLDACFSGNSAGGALVRQASGLAVTPRLPAAAPGMVVLSAAESGQLASWDQDARLGLFTRHLLDALSGAADRDGHGDGDGRVTLGEVKRYLDDEMTYQARRRFGRDQRATAMGDAQTVLATVAPGTPAPRPASAAGTVAAPAPAVREMDVEMVARENANVRSGPSTSRSKLAVIGRSRPVDVTGRSGDWYRVALADGRVGWVWRRLLGERPPPTAAAPARRYRPGESFKDCEICPEMVALPPGRFVMGSPTGETGRGAGEGPRRHVVLARALAVGKFEVTFAEWDACRADGGCAGHDPDDRGWGRLRRPVIGVSWRDARRYVAWLAARTGRPYRLPSEAEWEYAARAGTAAPWFWGVHGDGACMFANVLDRAALAPGPPSGAPSRCDDGYARTAPVGTFFVNRFGLHDMSGNVWEWVADCWSPDHAGAAGDGAARGGDDCRRRVLRGGSWHSKVSAVRSAVRHPGAVDERDPAVGFRVVRALEGDHGGLLPGPNDRPGTAIVRYQEWPRAVPPSFRRVVPPSFLRTAPPSFRRVVPPSFRRVVPPSFGRAIPPSFRRVVAVGDRPHARYRSARRNDYRRARPGRGFGRAKRRRWRRIHR